MKKLKLLACIFLLWNSFSVLAQLQFERVYGGAGYDYGYAVKQTIDSGYVVVGSTTSFGEGGTDAYLLKVDALGNANWDNTFGGINIDQAFDIVQVQSDSGYVITGYTNSFGSGGYDVYVVRTTKDGVPLWTKTYGGSDWDFGYSIQNTFDGGFIVAGGTFSYGNGNEDMYLLKIDMNGDTLWTKTYGGAYDDEAKSIKQTADSGFIFTGSTKSFGDNTGDIYTVRTDKNGDTLWTHHNITGTEEQGYDALESPFGTFFTAGRTKLNDNTFAGIRYIFNSSGALSSTIDTAFGGSDDDWITNIDMRPDARFTMTGTSYSFGFGLGTSDILINVFNPYDGFHGGTFGGTKNEFAYGMEPTFDNGYIICGVSNSYTTLDHIYLVKTDSNGVSAGSVGVILTEVPESNSTAGFHVFPNPAAGQLFFDASVFKNEELNYSVSNMLGQEVISGAAAKGNPEMELNVTDLQNGLYMLRLKGRSGQRIQKFMVQH
jgi:hypothetical protein